MAVKLILGMMRKLAAHWRQDVSTEQNTDRCRVTGRSKIPNLLRGRVCSTSEYPPYTEAIKQHVSVTRFRDAKPFSQ